MNSLSRLIDQGIAPMRSTMWGKAEPASNSPSNSMAKNIAIQYNNIYGTITNTHAEEYMDNVMITGSLISNPKEWSRFMERRTYLGVEFELPFIEWAETFGMTPILSSMNGAVCIMLMPIEKTLPAE